MTFCNTDRQQNAHFMDTAPDTHSEYQKENNYADDDCRNNQECCQPPNSRKLIGDSVILCRVRLECIVLPSERRVPLDLLHDSIQSGRVSDKKIHPPRIGSSFALRQGPKGVMVCEDGVSVKFHAWIALIDADDLHRYRRVFER